jgi:putative phosphoesterase
MLIGLLSDTHIRVPGTRSNLGQLWGDTLPLQISEAFRGVDLILHAGDIYTLPVLEELEKVAPVLAAEGDDDPFEIVNDKRVKSKHILNIEGITIGLAHQFEAWDLGKQEDLPDVIVFGHLHKPSLERRNGVLWVNPGSPTFPNYRYELGTIALLTVNNGKAEAQIIKLQGTLGGAGGSKMLR